MPFLFSYGTLQQREVQQATYGRLLMSTRDALLYYRLEPLEISDPNVVRLSGKGGAYDRPLNRESRRPDRRHLLLSDG